MTTNKSQGQTFDETGPYIGQNKPTFWTWSTIMVQDGSLNLLVFNYVLA